MNESETKEVEIESKISPSPRLSNVGWDAKVRPMPILVSISVILED